MKTAAEKSATTTASRSGHQSQPFFGKAGGMDFFAPAVQTKLTVGKEGDKFEQEADMMAEQVVQRSAMPNVQAKCDACEEKDKVQRKPLADGITPFIQRKEMEEAPVQRQAEEEEPVQAKRIQRQAEEEEQVQAKRIQRQEKEEEEPVQAKRIQRQAEEEEQVQAKRIQRQEKEEEEPVQAKHIQRQEKEEEEPVHAKHIQRQEKEEEEPMQAKRIQRQEKEEEEPMQAKRIQRQEKEEEEPVQAKRIQRQEKEKEEPVQTKSESGQARPSLSAVESVLGNAKGLGSRLPDPVQREMEAGYGVDFSNVCIHTDQAAVDMNQALHAQAFTHGWDVFFNQHKFNPATTSGKLLLAHELAHTIQQAKANGEALRPAQTREESEIPIVPDENEALKAATEKAAEQATEIKTQAEGEAAPEPQQEVAPAAPAKPAPRKEPVLPACKTAQSEAPKPAEAAPGAAGGPTVEPAPEAVPEQAPRCPADDPDFAKAKKQIAKDAKKQRVHDPAEQKKDEMMASSALPAAEQNLQSGQEQQTQNFENAAQPKPFDRVEFKRKLKEKIESKMPETEDEAKAFAGSGKLEKAKDEFKDTVSEEKSKVSGPLEQTAAAETLPEGKDLKPDNVEVPAAKPADKPAAVPSGLAAPKPRTDEEISLEHKSKALDDQMAQEGLTEKQMEEWEETENPKPLTAKKDAQREIAAAPGHYRLLEQEQLAQSTKQADKATGRELRNMANEKTTKTGEVFSGQKAKETATEKRQREIKEEIERIYTSTETDVTKILEDLSTTVENTFATEVEKANETFKDRVRTRLDDHYGWFTFDDKIAEWAGLSDGVAHIFREEKANFLKTMDTALDDIATTVETELNRALERIQQGRTDLENFKKTLSADELKFAEDLLAEAMEKFTELEASVSEHQNELIETLSDQYVESVNKLQEQFDQINEELSASWIADAFSFIGEVATAIKKLGELLSSIASRIGQYVSAILASPKRFFNNLVAGITSGMDDFKENIDTYLEQGFWMWLTGATSGVNIEIPKTMNVEGMFSLAAQILGITKDFILRRIQAVLRIPVDKFMAFLEKADSVAAKFMEPVKILFTQGIGALWTWVKDEVSSKLDEIFGGLKTEIFQAIIKKFLLWVASLFVPGLGFVKLIQAAYKALRWFVDNIDRIVDIVNAFLDAIGLAVEGNVSAIRQKIVKALTNGVVIAIDFLAKLVGLGNFGDKLQRGIQKLQKPVHGAIDFLLKKARPYVNKIRRAVEKGVRGVKEKGKEAAKKLFAWWKAKRGFKDGKGESHNLYFSGAGKSAKLMVASTNPAQVRKYLAGIKVNVPPQKTNDWKAADGLNDKIEDLQINLDKKNENVSNKVQANQKEYEELNGKMKELADKLAALMTITDAAEPPPPVLPPFSNNVRATSIEASYLTAKQGFPAGETSDKHYGNLGGWQELQDSGVRARDNFVKMHLLHHKLGGKATDSNLTPAKSTINSEYYRDIEAPALRDSGLMEGRKKKGNKVIWYKVNVGYHGGKAYEKNFISSINASYGYHEPDKNWAKGPAVDTWKAAPGVPDLKLKIFALNEDGKTALSEMKKSSGRKYSKQMIDLIVLEKKEPFGKSKKKKYESSSELASRLLNRIQKERGWDVSALIKEITEIRDAVDNPKINIKLYGAD